MQEHAYNVCKLGKVLFMKKNLLLLLILLFLCGCNHNNTRVITEVSDFTISTTSELSELSGEKLPLDLLNPAGILSIDTFLLVFQPSEERMIKVYNNKCQFLGEFLQKGGGPDEVAVFGGFTQWYMEDGEAKILIQSYPQYLGILNVNRSITQKRVVFDKKYDFCNNEKSQLFQECNAVFRLRDDRLMLTKSPERSRKMDNLNTYFEVYDYSANLVLNSFYAMNLPNLDLRAPALYNGPMTLKPDLSKIGAFCLFLNTYSITDIESGKSKQFFLEGDQLILMNKESGMRNAIENPAHQYWGVCSTNDKIIALSKGGATPVNLNEDETPSYLRFFDWEGNLLCQVIIKDNLKCITLDENSGCIYGVLMNDEIKKYSIKPLL